jgi:hypothetical protein
MSTRATAPPVGQCFNASFILASHQPLRSIAICPALARTAVPRLAKPVSYAGGVNHHEPNIHMITMRLSGSKVVETPQKNADTGL